MHVFIEGIHYLFQFLLSFLKVTDLDMKILLEGDRMQSDVLIMCYDLVGSVGRREHW